MTDNNKNDQPIFSIDQTCFTKYPNFKAGILAMEGVENVVSHEEVQNKKTELENLIREKFSGFTREDLNKLAVIEAYNNYYRQFEKTYHVRSQVESIIKGKSLPGVSAMLDAMFMAELKNMLLTAGHDLDTLKLPVSMAVADGTESYVGMGGSEKKTYAGDLMMKDEQGIISSILNGPDSRTKIMPSTRNVLFAVYIPAEIDKETVLEHLRDIQSTILLFSKNAKTRLLDVFEAN
jgi:DNA/RNA-binding domain of Phe-tRNA-synthetase-like protein